MTNERQPTPDEVQKRYADQLRRQRRNRLIFAYPALAFGSAALIFCACRYGTADDFRQTAKTAAGCCIGLVIAFVAMCIAEIWRWRK